MFMHKVITVKVARRLMARFQLVLALLVLGVALGSIATASPVGFLTVGICSLPGSGVSVSGPGGVPANTIDWQPPIGGGNGCTVTGVGTSVAYTGGGPLINAVTGTIKDLTLGGGTVTDFMTFVGNPNLHFDLSGLGPGPANTICATTLDPNAPACQVGGGSPFKLTPTSGGTDIALAANGIARDTSGINSTWVGNYSTTFPGITPAQIQQAIVANATVAGFCSAGTCTSPYSGTFSVTLSAVPEPVSLVLIGCGLIGLAIVKRRTA